MAFLGQWFGFETANSQNEDGKKPVDRQTAGQHIDQVVPAGSAMETSSPPLVICRGKRPIVSPSSDTPNNGAPLRKTKSDEILRDFDAMRFLCEIDESLKRQEKLLSSAELDRLQTLYAQASVDQCSLLLDIIDHFEMEHEKLRCRLANAAPGSAASDALRSRRNMLVF